MRPYLRALKQTSFAKLWVGATVSTLGDGMTFLALSWLVLAQPGGTARIGLLGICYTAPVVVGGWLVGWLLDRYDKRLVLIADSLLRAVAVASIPVTAAMHAMPDWLPFVVAATYGLLKMVPLAGFPSAIPQLVGDGDLDAANALESLSFSVASVVGPAAAGVLIGLLGAANVLLIDSVSFLFFAAMTALVSTPLRPVDVAEKRPVMRTLWSDRVIVATTVAFMAFNIAEGMLLVAGPWLAKTQLVGGAAALGGLTAALAGGEIAGAAIAGSRRPESRPVRAIGLVQMVGALAFLGLLAAPQVVLVGVAYFAIGFFSAPMTVWAQSLRMRRIPGALHGRAFATLRTFMQATPTVGAAVVTPLLVVGELGIAAVVMAVIAGVPAVYLVGRRME